MGHPVYSRKGGRTARIETSYYGQEKKAIAMLLVTASESSKGQTEALLKRQSNVVFGLVSCLIQRGEVCWINFLEKV